MIMQKAGDGRLERYIAALEITALQDA